MISLLVALMINYMMLSNLDPLIKYWNLYFWTQLLYLTIKKSFLKLDLGTDGSQGTYKCDLRNAV
jgi:hypothetical protein